MAILEKKVWVSLHSRNVKHFEKLGYNIPKIQNKLGRFVFVEGVKILVNVDDILGGTRVTKVCDDCGKYSCNQRYDQIIRQRKNGDGKDRCLKCANVKIGKEQKSNVVKERSLEFWAMSNDKKYLLEEYSKKNKKLPSRVTRGDNAEYLWECKICNSEFKMSVNKRTSGRNCPYCRGFRVNETNCLWTTHPQIAKMMLNSEDGYKYTKGTHTEVDWKCPECNYIIKNKSIDNVVYGNFSCPKCSDGISYPEKFMMNFLLQLNINFETQKMFNWSKNIFHPNKKISGTKRYDFYIPHLNCIIETHGKQHFNGGYEYLGGKTMEEEQENDELKKKMALENKINDYIVIDCSISDPQYIKNNIILSNISLLYDIKKVNWEDCHEFACSSLVKKACDFWQEDTKKLIEISKKMNISTNTVRKYLKQGSKLGWCDYKPKKKSQKDIVQLTLDLKIIKKYQSMREAARILNVGQGNISKVCNGVDKTAYGFKWMFKEDYDKYIDL